MTTHDDVTYAASAADADTAAAYAGSRETTEGIVFTVTGQDWDSVVQGVHDTRSERVVVNMGPQHPSTHGVLRLILELDGETVTEARCGIGYLHTGIEKNLEYRSWTQGVTFVTRMDYLSPFFNETAYCLAVERLLGITEQVPERATVIRVMLMELNRISSHLVCLATGGMELGALTAMIFGFREREMVLDIFELVTGLRMNHAYIRPGGVAQDLPPGAVDTIAETLGHLRRNFTDTADLLVDELVAQLAEERAEIRCRLFAHKGYGHQRRRPRNARQKDVAQIGKAVCRPEERILAVERSVHLDGEERVAQRGGDGSGRTFADSFHGLLNTA